MSRRPRPHPAGGLKGHGFKSTDWALASLGVMAKLGLVIRPEMLEAALAARLKGDALTGALEIVRRLSRANVYSQRSTALAINRRKAHADMGLLS